MKDIIVNYQELNDHVATGGTVDYTRISELKAAGITHIMDLRTAAEIEPHEMDAAAKAGIAYAHIPVGAEGITVGSLAAFTDWYDGMAAKAPKVLVHCRSGNRVGAMWALYQMQHGVAEDIALAEGRKAGMQPGLEEMVKAHCQKC